MQYVHHQPHCFDKTIDMSSSTINFDLNMLILQKFKNHYIFFR